MTKVDLVPLNKRTPEEVKKITSMGGIASAKVRRERKTIRETLLYLLSKGDTQDNISLAIIQKALDGSEKAFEVIRDTIGEKPTETIANINVDNEAYKELSIEELKKLAGE